MHTFLKKVCNSVSMAKLATLLSCVGFVSVSSVNRIIPCGLWLVPAVQDREQPKHSLVFLSAWPLPLITCELTNCQVTLSEPATFAAHFKFQAHTKCEHRLIQSLLELLFWQSKRMGCRNAFSG